VIVSAQSTLDDVNDLSERLSLPQIPGNVSWLGSDFVKSTDGDTEIQETAKHAVEAGKYILTIGTIEPRKNHKVLLDAFDGGLFQEGWNLVFAGKIGWNVANLEKRIRGHAQLNKHFFFVEKANDATIDYLYRHAQFVAFPTFYEGFGLPMIEAFERKVPVIASDIRVLREVGEDYAVYFDPENPAAFRDAVKEYSESKTYKTLRKRLNSYKAYSWDTVAERVEKALLELEITAKAKVDENVSQIVIMSAREDDVLGSLPFIEAFMPYIKRLLLCCPDEMVDAFQKKYAGRLTVSYLTDSELLAGRQLPQDHSVRNFFLRCLLMESDRPDDVFIMSDDDYRPLQEIPTAFFVENGKYKGYYCYDLTKWQGTIGHMTSFDYCMFRTKEFLLANGMPVRQYASHMPQIIDKRIYRELLNTYTGIEETGVDEWGTYFNYLAAHYPENFESLPYVTMCWPGHFSDWNMMVKPEELLFENYYASSYEENGIFEGFEADYHEGILQDNERKKYLYRLKEAEHDYAVREYEKYRSLYKWMYGEVPSFGIYIGEREIQLALPRYFMMHETGVLWVPFDIRMAGSQKGGNIGFSVNYVDVSGKHIAAGPGMEPEAKSGTYQFPVRPIAVKERYSMRVTVRYKGMSTTRTIPVLR